MAGVITIKFSVIKNGQAELGMKGGVSPIYIPGPVEPQFGPGRMIYFEGFSVDQHGKQHYMDATVAYRQTCLRVIEYLKRYGYRYDTIQFPRRPPDSAVATIKFIFYYHVRPFRVTLQALSIS